MFCEKTGNQDISVSVNTILTELGMLGKQRDVFVWAAGRHSILCRGRDAEAICKISTKKYVRQDRQYKEWHLFLSGSCLSVISASINPLLCACVRAPPCHSFSLSDILLFCFYVFFSLICPFGFPIVTRCSSVALYAVA